MLEHLILTFGTVGVILAGFSFICMLLEAAIRHIDNKKPFTFPEVMGFVSACLLITVGFFKLIS